MSTLAVVEQILRDSKVPMSVREIVERAGPTLPTKSKTPDTVVARDLSMDIKKKGEDSIFIRTSPGRYTMRCYVVEVERAEQAVATDKPSDGETTDVVSASIRGERAGTKSVQQRSSTQDDSQSASV